jgi:hypothetical protein
MSSPNGVGYGTTIKEIQVKNDVLERKNFDLKMQIYYLNEKLESHQDRVTLNDDYNNVDKNLEDRFNYSLINDENMNLKRKIQELDNELINIKLNIRNDDNNNNKDENEDDSIIINKFEKELIYLRNQNDKYKIKINEYERDINLVTESNFDKDKIILDLNIYIDNIQKNKDDNFSRLENIREPMIPLSPLNNLRNYNNNNINNNNNNKINNINLSDNDLTILDEEINQIILDNNNLKIQLEKEKIITKNQELAYQRVKASAEEIALIEAEEIIRLETELEKSLNIKQDLQKKFNNYELDNMKLIKKNEDLEKYIHERIRLSDDTENAFFDSNLLTNTRINNNNKEENDLLNMYKQREIELLNALEGVICRCKELENNK